MHSLEREGVRKVAQAKRVKKGHWKANGKGACFLEIGYGKAAFISGNFLAAPKPQLNLKMPSRKWRYGKTLVEKYWLWKHF